MSETKHTPELTAEQMRALQAYASTHGRTWKAQLNHEWMTGTARGTLQQVRNTFGPTWLVRFRLPKEKP
jgi:hypothetical protein